MSSTLREVIGGVGKLGGILSLTAICFFSSIRFTTGSLVCLVFHPPLVVIDILLVPTLQICASFHYNQDMLGKYHGNVSNEIVIFLVFNANYRVAHRLAVNGNNLS